MILQDCLGFVCASITNNWSSTPIGINYNDKWKNIEKNFNINNNKIYLIHYLGMTKYNDYNLFFKDYYKYYYRIMKKEEILKFNQINNIINLKDSFWKFGKESQINWFMKNINLNDNHILLYDLDKLIGYGVKKIFDSYSILDSIIIDNKYINNKLEKIIINNLIRNDNKLIILLCDDYNIIFYENFGFKLDNNIIINDKQTNNLNIMSLNSNLEYSEINYY